MRKSLSDPLFTTTGYDRKNQERYLRRVSTHQFASNELNYKEITTGKKLPNIESLLFKKCVKLIEDVIQHPLYNVIKNDDSYTKPTRTENGPLALHIVEERLKQGYYDNSFKFVKDMRRVWKNPKGDKKNHPSLFKAKVKLRNHFERLLHISIPSLSKARIRGKRKLNSSSIIEESKDEKEISMTEEEKNSLKKDISELDKNHIKEALNIIRSEITLSKKARLSDIDFTKLPNLVCQELKNYVANLKWKVNLI